MFYEKNQLPSKTIVGGTTDLKTLIARAKLNGVINKNNTFYPSEDCDEQFVVKDLTDIDRYKRHVANVRERAVSGVERVKARLEAEAKEKDTQKD